MQTQYAGKPIIEIIARQISELEQILDKRRQKTKEIEARLQQLKQRLSLAEWQAEGGAITERMKRITEQRDGRGLTFKAIAENEGLSPQRVRTLYAKARRITRQTAQAAANSQND